MARKSFDSMLANINQTQTPPSKTTESRGVAKSKPAEATSGRTVARDGVSYKDLERKEVRLRAEQFDALTTLQRRLNRERNHEGYRITENTLIRLGIDLLLERTEALTGATESELAESLGLSK